MLHRQRGQVLPEAGQQVDEEGVMDSPLSAAGPQMPSDTSMLKMNRASLLWTIRPAPYVGEVQCLAAEVDPVEDPAILPEEMLREAVVPSLQGVELNGGHEEAGETGKRYVCMPSKEQSPPLMYMIV